MVLIACGVPQTLSGAVTVNPLEGGTQTIAIGPVAFQEAIKLLGTNGGGFFNANSAHPFENPTAVSNVVETWSEIVIPFALTVTFVLIVRDKQLEASGYAVERAETAATRSSSTWSGGRYGWQASRCSSAGASTSCW